MQLTPAIKGQLTRAYKAVANGEACVTDNEAYYLQTQYTAVFTKHMPREQAKHAARKHLATRRLEIAGAVMQCMMTGKRPSELASHDA